MWTTLRGYARNKNEEVEQRTGQGRAKDNRCDGGVNLPEVRVSAATMRLAVSYVNPANKHVEGVSSLQEKRGATPQSKSQRRCGKNGLLDAIGRESMPRGQPSLITTSICYRNHRLL